MQKPSVSNFKQSAKQVFGKTLVTGALIVTGLVAQPFAAFAHNNNDCPPPPPQQQTICVESSSSSSSSSYSSSGNPYYYNDPYYYYGDPYYNPYNGYPYNNNNYNNGYYYWDNNDDCYYYWNNDDGCYYDNNGNHHHHHDIDVIIERDDAYKTYIGVFHDPNNDFSTNHVVLLFGDKNNDYRLLNKSNVDDMISDLEDQKDEYKDADRDVPKWIDKELKALKSARDDAKYYIDHPSKRDSLVDILDKFKGLAEPGHCSIHNSKNDKTVTVTINNGNTYNYCYTPR